jgi:D-glycero-alpha-D-manno-heptose-7-phosphate kinase
MIVSRAPLRFSLGGGGSDLPGYYQRFGGYVVSSAIDRYVYVAANERFYDDIRLAYSQTEIVPDVASIRHPLFREALRLVGIERGIELVSVADVPSNTGLGSSSSFTVALLNALHAYRKDFVSSRRLAEEACEIELERLGEPAGKQDQYMAAFGNVTALAIDKAGNVSVEPVPVREEVLDDLQSSLLIFYSGVERQARVVLGEQAERFRSEHGAALEAMHRIKELGHEVYRLLVAGDVDRYGELLHAHWQHKRALASSMTDPALDEIYEAARGAGALGGKLMGAGGGGFFMFYVRPADRRRVWETLAGRGLKPLRFRFDRSGARIVTNVQRG